MTNLFKSASPIIVLGVAMAFLPMGLIAPVELGLSMAHAAGGGNGGGGNGGGGNGGGGGGGNGGGGGGNAGGNSGGNGGGASADHSNSAEHSNTEGHLEQSDHLVCAIRTGWSHSMSTV
jgi:hypothetical protein